MLACLLNHPDHQPLLHYLSVQSSATYLPLLEQAVYAARYTPRPDSPAAFSYHMGGNAIRRDFSQSRQVYIELGEAQLAEADFQVLEGQVGYGIYYTGGFDEAEKALPEGVSITQSLSSGDVKLGDTVWVTTTITFDGQASVAYYHISQIVPAGMRFVRVADYNYYQGWYYRKGEGGAIDFYINPLRGPRSESAFNEPAMPTSLTFTYEARAVLPGTYLIEAPAISYSGSNTLYSGERERIRIVD